MDEMFESCFCRKIEIDLEELECEGIEPILIDWQGGFVGSVANDLMWAMYPFFERDKELGKKVRILDSHSKSSQTLNQMSATTCTMTR